MDSGQQGCLRPRHALHVRIVLQCLDVDACVACFVVPLLRPRCGFFEDVFRGIGARDLVGEITELRGSDFLVGWSEDRIGGTRLLAIGISTAGTPSGGVLDLAGGPISGDRRG